MHKRKGEYKGGETREERGKYIRAYCTIETKDAGEERNVGETRENIK